MGVEIQARGPETRDPLGTLSGCFLCKSVLPPLILNGYASSSVMRMALHWLHRLLQVYAAHFGKHSGHHICLVEVRGMSCALSDFAHSRTDLADHRLSCG